MDSSDEFWVIGGDGRAPIDSGIKVWSIKGLALRSSVSLRAYEVSCGGDDSGTFWVMHKRALEVGVEMSAAGWVCRWLSSAPG